MGRMELCASLSAHGFRAERRRRARLAKEVEIEKLRARLAGALHELECWRSWWWGPAAEKVVDEPQVEVVDNEGHYEDELLSAEVVLEDKLEADDKHFKVEEETSTAGDQTCVDNEAEVLTEADKLRKIWREEGEEAWLLAMRSAREVEDSQPVGPLSVEEEIPRYAAVTKDGSVEVAGVGGGDVLPHGHPRALVDEVHAHWTKIVALKFEKEIGFDPRERSIFSTALRRVLLKNEKLMMATVEFGGASEFEKLVMREVTEAVEEVEAGMENG